jgi:3-oxoacyl-[acyl-carrier protein] reductase
VETGLSQDDRRVALVSGGSRGIGAATVRRLAADGWDVGFCYRDNGSSAREVEKAACELGVRVTGTDVDVTDAAEVTSWFRLSEEELGPVQALVSCAGISRDRPLAQLDEADWRMVIDTSLDGVFHLCRAAVFAMMERQSGQIVMVSSVCGEYDHGPRGDGTLGRPGIAGFVRALASQTRRFGIAVNAVTPGPGARDMAGLLPDRPRADLAETIALRRFGTAASVADLVARLLAADAPDVTGRVLEVPSALAFLSLRLVRDKKKGTYAERPTYRAPRPSYPGRAGQDVRFVPRW